MKKSKLLIGTSLLTVALLLAACGSTGSGAVSAPTSAAAAPTTAVAAEPTTAPAEPTAAAAEPTAVAVEPTTAAATPTTAVTQTSITKLNLNTATGDDYLKAIPGFSSRMVREFLEYRPYVSIQQFRREIGKCTLGMPWWPSTRSTSTYRST